MDRKRERHGMSKTRIYKLWTGMMQRCYNASSTEYKNYGGRGINVCERWHSFINFFEDMGYRPDKLTLDRKDNDSGYSKENCKWSTSKEQVRNKRNRLPNKNNSTGIPGVYWKSTHNKYVARITENGKRIYIGFFETIDDAKKAMIDRGNYAIPTE